MNIAFGMMYMKKTSFAYDLYTSCDNTFCIGMSTTSNADKRKLNDLLDKELQYTVLFGAGTVTVHVTASKRYTILLDNNFRIMSMKEVQ